MKKLVMILIAFMGVTGLSYAQDGTKQTQPTKIEPKVQKKPVRKMIRTEEKKKEEPIKKVD
ncbi:hypothetical protein [Fluviicola sp.]|jgi:hypothetical protein|uniref:hypothetical protein n=1 Tax=Fluviicola sp. TaxID=1917219 RepID=UPI002839265F|nr:hypothetical protein [Fluviicola sp.]MDR0803335.1 hypothetical protein [Fluviicola sp.]